MRKDEFQHSADLSELEGGVLAMLHIHPASTAHAIREKFLRSRSSHWSGSAGAIYPLLKRLHKAELLSMKEGARGTRVRRVYTLTALGLRALKRWIGPPLAPWMASVTFDPLRTRIPFLGALSAAKQATVLVEAERLLSEELQELRRERRLLEGPNDFWEAAALDGCLAVTQARLQWIRRTTAAFEQR